MDRPVDIGERAGLLSPCRCRKDDIGQLRRLREEDVLDDEEEAGLRQNRANPLQFRQRHRRVCAADPQQADGPILHVAHHLHDMRRG